MADLKYNFLEDNFTTYQNVETPKVELDLPLLDFPLDISDWASGISPSGVPIVKDTTSPKPYWILNNTEEPTETPVIEPTKDVQKRKSSQQVTQSPKEFATQFFESKGLSNYMAAGIVGNLIQESNLNTSVKGDKGTSFGIAQWRGSRLDGLKNFAKERNTDISDLETQLEYIWKELNSSYKSALDGILNSRNSDEATTIFMRRFEKPNERYANLTARLKYAQSCLT